MPDRFDEALHFGTWMRDRVTGAEGICIAQTLHLTGCEHVVLQRPHDPVLDKEDKLPRGQEFDLRRCEVLAEEDRVLLPDAVTATYEEMRAWLGRRVQQPFYGVEGVVVAVSRYYGGELLLYIQRPANSRGELPQVLTLEAGTCRKLDEEPVVPLPADAAVATAPSPIGDLLDAERLY